MEKKKIKVKFLDWGPDLAGDLNPILPFLNEMYDVEFSDNPDYVFCSVVGYEHTKYDAIKIFYTGENLIPNFNFYDYAIGFDPLSFGDRYLRVPLYNFYSAYKNLLKWESEREERISKLDSSRLLNRKFCSYVVSNGDGDPIRTKFFEELSKYKRVDSGGRYMNNIGGPVPDKLAFCAEYKFNIAFENSASSGYTTEKIMEPLSVNSIPIYWGNPLVEDEFYGQCMVRVKDEADIKRAVEEIIYLDTHDDAYLEKCLSPRLVHPDSGYYDDALRAFLRNIIDKPIADARRLIPFACQRAYRLFHYFLYRIWWKIEKPWKYICLMRTKLVKMKFIRQKRRI